MLGCLAVHYEAIVLFSLEEDIRHYNGFVIKALGFRSQRWKRSQEFSSLDVGFLSLSTLVAATKCGLPELHYCVNNGGTPDANGQFVPTETGGRTAATSYYRTRLPLYENALVSLN